MGKGKKKRPTPCPKRENLFLSQGGRKTSTGFVRSLSSPFSEWRVPLVLGGSLPLPALWARLGRCCLSAVKQGLPLPLLGSPGAPSRCLPPPSPPPCPENPTINLPRSDGYVVAAAKKRALKPSCDIPRGAKTRGGKRSGTWLVFLHCECRGGGGRRKGGSCFINLLVKKVFG